MLTPSVVFLLLVSARIAECRSILDLNHVHMRYKRQNQGADGLTLVANAVQSGSAGDGSVNGVSAAGQSKSQVSQDNFINFCKGKTLTNGLQVQGGSCNGIPMGDIPSKQNMVSSIITFPIAASATLVEKTDFDISVQMINFVAGSFTNAQLTYYSAPQALQGGKIVGHTHVTIQDMGPNLNPKQPLDATKFVFFKGINDAGDGNGLLSAKVPGGLPAGNYRVCTMASASNHQLVLMPVAQRGAQDDCTKFTVIAAGGGGGNGGNGGNGDDAQDVSSTSVAANSATSTSEIESSTSVSLSVAETSPAEPSPVEISASETSEVVASTTESATETSIIESLPILSSSPPPFANTSFAAAKTTTTRGRGGNGKPPKTKTTTAKLSTTTRRAAPSTKVAAVALSTTKSVISSTTSTATTTTSQKATFLAPAIQTTTRKAGNNGGKTPKPNTSIKVVNKGTVKVIKIVHKVTIIRTFFTFKNSLGGMPPAVNKKGNLFAVVDQLFDSLTSACDAACGAQYKTCISFTGPGFEVVKCKQQRKECGEAAKVVTSSAAETPKIVTATVTVPPSASVPGQIIGEETVVSTVQVPASSSSSPPVVGAGPEPTLAPVINEEDIAEPSATQEEAAAIPPTETTIVKLQPAVVTPQETIAPLATSSEAVCALVTQTVTVDNFILASPSPSSTSTSTTSTTLTPLPTIPKPLFSNFTSITSIAINLPTPTLSQSSSTPTPLLSTSTTLSTTSTTNILPSPSKAAIANIPAPPITSSNDRIRPFSVNGNTFTSETAAKQRSCDVQFNRCADAVNGGRAIGVVIGDCEGQREECVV